MSERSIFIRALELDDPAQREALLSRECARDAELRERIERLLSAHAAAGGILDKPAVAPPATDLFRPITEGPGTVIGPYKLLQQIGEGGFGVVYMAEQQRPVRRKVALKIIKPGMDTREVIARFESERQALALMDHPNIARVLDAGATESSRPYFVMELVKGVPITEYCDKNALPTDQRLALFIAICHAVQHAHQKGVIHRDLKPSNVMVTLHDGHPVPKVIDFGVSKATSQQLTEKTLFTAYGQMIGTPAYMSPEQAEMSGLDIDTRSDTYSLGVLLYELLTGTTPFDGKRLREAGYVEMQRIIREEAPPRPSTRVSTMGDALTVVSNHRSTDPKRLGQQLRGDLDVIVMKALEKERNRRYDTPNAFADDIQRFLQHEAIVARPASPAYRLKKFVQRNKAAVAAVAAIAAALLIGTVTSTWLAVREGHASRLAESERVKAEASLHQAVAAKGEAERERERAESNAKAALASERKAIAAAEEAEKAKDAEASQRKLAETNEQVALQEKNKTLAAKEELRETLYASEMNLVQAAAESRQYARAAQLLQRQRPAAGQPDFRGFEWHYWQRRLKLGWLRSVEVPQLAARTLRPGGTRSFSRGAARVAAFVEYPSDSSVQAGFGWLAVFDGVTGRELVAPFDPFPDQQREPGGNRWLFMTMSDDGTRLAATLGARLSGPLSTAKQAGYVSIRDAATGSEIRRIENPGAVCDIALTADGSRLAVEYGDNRQETALAQSSAQTGVKIWDTSTGECVQTLPMLPWTSLVNRLLWSPDGTRLLRQSVFSETMVRPDKVNRQILQIVDVASGEELWEREFTNRRVHDAWSWSPDGKLLVIFEVAEPGLVAKNNVQLWDSHTGTTLAILDREVTSNAYFNSNVVFSPDGQRLAVASRVNEIYVWDVPKLPLANGDSPLHIAEPDLTLHAAGEEIQGLAFSADGRKLHSLDAGGSLGTWDATAREDTGIGPDSLGERFVADISADATKIAFNVGLTNSLCSVWDLVNNREVCRLKTAGATARRPLFSPDGRRVALVARATTPEEETQIVIHDAQTGEALNAIRVKKLDSSLRYPIVNLDFRPDGRQLAALILTPSPNLSRQRLVAWDTATGEQVFSVATDVSSSGALWYTHDGASLMLAGRVGRSDEAAVFYDAITGEREKSIPLPSSSGRSFFNVRHQMFGANVRSDFVLGDLATGQERLRLSGYNDVNEMTISPDGSRLLLTKYVLSSTGERDSELTVWSLKSGRRLMAFNQQGYLSAISFSPDGNRLIGAFSQSGSAAVKPIQIWDATPLPEKP